MGNLMQLAASRQAKYNARPMDLSVVTVISKRIAFTNNYSIDPETGRKKRDEKGNIKLDHINYRIQLADGTITSILVRQDMVKNEPSSILGTTAHCLQVEGDELKADNDKMNAKAGEHYINVAELAFDFSNYELFAKAGGAISR